MTHHFHSYLYTNKIIYIYFLRDTCKDIHGTTTHNSVSDETTIEQKSSNCNLNTQWKKKISNEKKQTITTAYILDKSN